jgi:undecaprenyl pyrophosphate phosphatase UppP
MKKIRDVVAVTLTLFVLLMFGMLAIRGIIEPPKGSARFGLAALDGASAAYYRVYLSRNLVIIGSALAFLALGHKRSVAVLMSLVALLPLFDMAILLNEVGEKARLTVHQVGFVLLALSAVLLWARAAGEKTPAREREVRRMMPGTADEART